MEGGRKVPVALLILALVGTLGACARTSSRGPVEVVRAFVQAVQRQDKQSAEELVAVPGGGPSELGGAYRAWLVEQALRELPPEVQWDAALERQAGETAYVAVRVKYTAAQLADKRKPFYRLGRPAVWMPGLRERVPSGPVPADVLERWMKEPPGDPEPHERRLSELSERRSSLIRELNRATFRTAWGAGRKDETVRALETEVAKLEREMVEIMVRDLVPAYTYKAIVDDGYTPGRDGNVYVRTLRFEVGRGSKGEWKVREFDVKRGD